MLHGVQTIEILASNFERSRKFYRDIVGGHEGRVLAPYRAEFQLGALRLVVAPMRQGWMPVTNCVMAVLHTDNLEKDLHELQRLGVAVLRAPHHNEFGWHAEIADPDGYRIGLFEPSGGSVPAHLYSQAEFEKKVTAITRDLREAMTRTMKVPKVVPAAKAETKKAAKPAVKKAALKPAKKAVKKSVSKSVSKSAKGKR